MLMHRVLIEGAERTPDKLALHWVDRDVALTYARAVAGMEHMAGALASLGVGQGDRVTIVAHNGMDYLLCLFGAWRIGAVAALVNVQFAAELDYYFGDHTPSVVIYTHDMADPVHRAAQAVGTVRHLICMDGRQAGALSLPELMNAQLPAPADPGDENAIAHLAYTSGTTGKPKGACLAHEPTMRAARCIAERLRITAEDHSFGPTALSSSYQLVGNLLPPLSRGASVHIGGLGVSGDSSCADHAIAFRMRKLAHLDGTPGGVAPDSTDNIIYAPLGTAPTGFEQPHCFPQDLSPLAVETIPAF